MKVLMLVLTVVFLSATLLGCEGNIDVRGKVYFDNSRKPYLRIVGDSREILDDTLKPLSGVKVELLMPSEYTHLMDNPWREEATDPDGSFRLFSTVPRGYYKFIIRMSKEDYEPIEIELDYMRDRRATLEGVMIKKQQ